jgi:Rrf2 family iron-sulfur cluster assembly transcriptional regulator
MRMTLGRRADYAIRAMLALATDEDGGRPTSVREISDRMAIPVRFLPHVMRDLGRAGLVVGSTGRTGGYRLGRPAGRISILEVLDAVEPGPPVPRCVLRGGPCRPDGRCAVHDVVAGATEALRGSLSGTTLAEIVLPGNSGAATPREP